jgi:membrane-bound lytic murein transglycosylase B
MRLLALAIAMLLAQAAWAQAKPYAKRPDVREFIREMSEQHGFVPRELDFLFARVRRAEPILKAIQPQARPRSWEEYRGHFLTERRIAEGTEFWKAHRATLARAERAYGVPAQYIVAIIGIETFYGRHTGKWRVVDALTTLAFDYPPRAEFFRGELVNYLLLARNEGFDVFSVRGSYAGAIGIPQFMPGSIRHYAVDFDGDGAIDLRGSPADAIGSVANFLKEHGWQSGREVSYGARVSGEAWRRFADGSVDPKHPVSELAQAGVAAEGSMPAESSAALIELPTPGGASEYRLGLKNFWVLTRYNRSAFYAAAVTDLGRELGKAQDPGR